MSTVDEMTKLAESNIAITKSDSATPAGYFLLTVKILGIPTVYLAKGTQQEYVIAGRVELPTGDAYKGAGIKGGSYLGRVHTFAETFAAMI